MKTYKLIM